MGHTAIAEIQFADYIFPAFDQVRSINTLAYVVLSNDVDCERGCQVQIPRWRAVFHRWSDNPYANNGSRTWWFIPFTKSRRLLCWCLRAQGYICFFCFYGSGVDTNMGPDRRLSFRGRQFNAKDCSWHQFVIPIPFSSWNRRSCIVLQVTLHDFLFLLCSHRSCQSSKYQ